MIRANNIVSVGVKDCWFRFGLDYALISWTSTFNRMGKPNPYKRLQKILIGVIAENAFEKYLIDNDIVYETSGKTKWYEVDRYDIGINGYAVDVKSSFLDTTTVLISTKCNDLFRDKLTWFLQCHALVPLDQFNPGKNKRRAHKRDKIYSFPFVEGYFKEQSWSKPLVHAFWDYKWLKRAEYKSLPNLGKLKVEYAGHETDAFIRIHGTTKSKTACIEDVNLNKRKQRTLNDFFQVFSVEWRGNNKPTAEVRITSDVLKITETIKPECTFELKRIETGYWPIENNWQSIALHNSKVYLLGWIYEEDLRIIGNEYKRFTKTIEQYAETKVDNWGCRIQELEPMNTIKGCKL